MFFFIRSSFGTLYKFFFIGVGGGLVWMVIFVLCMTCDRVGVIIDGCFRLNLQVYISYVLKIYCTKIIKAWDIAKVRNLFLGVVVEIILATPPVGSVR
jgi:hypothetical protein